MPHIIHTESGRLASATPRSAVTSLVRDAVSHPGGGGIVLHFHGGLVKSSVAYKIADRLTPEYEAGGAYPVFFVWESGLVEAIQNNLGEIGGEKLFRLLWKRVLKIVVRKAAQSVGHRAAETLPPANTQAVEHSIDAALDAEDTDLLLDPELDGGLQELTETERMLLESELLYDAALTLELQKVSNGLLTPAETEQSRRARGPQVRGSTKTLMDPAALDQFVDRPQPGARGILSTAKLFKEIVALAARVIRRLLNGRHHGLHATVVEEILRSLYLANVGKLIWDTMKQDTADAFGPDPDVFGGTAFLAELARQIDPAVPPRITLVGHSAGSVFIAEFLDHAAQVLPPSVRYDVAFLAPAATFDRTAAVLAAHADQIDRFRVFTMTDEYETLDQLVPVLYPHSLLYFISGVLEGGNDVPITGMARFFDPERYHDDAFGSVQIVRDYLLADPAILAWSVTTDNVDGRRSTSKKHGDFDNDGPTIGSVIHLIASSPGA